MPEHRQGRGLQKEQSLVGTTDPEMEQERGVPCRVGRNCFSPEAGMLHWC